MPLFRKHLPLILLAVVFYLPGSFNLPTDAVARWLVQLPGGMSMSSCGCLDPQCGCGAACCASKNDDSGGGSCCESETLTKKAVLKSACTCGSGTAPYFVTLADQIYSLQKTNLLFIPYSRPAIPWIPVMGSVNHPGPADKIPISLLFV
ncbi:MAG: hypothetical protein GY780_12200 [bacterium]|nr:hypothetical protein [bacterium]